MEAPPRTRLAVLALALIALTPGSARAAEVVTGAPDEVPVAPGGLVSFEVEVTAEGVIDCGVSRSSPATARYDTVHSLVGTGPPAGETPGDLLPFYANSQLVLLPPLGCGVTWDGAPDPYRFFVTVAAAPDAQEGRYDLELTAEVSNPGTIFAPLEDREPKRLTVVVTRRPPLFSLPLGELPPPLEDRSINLLPVRGVVGIRYPGTPRWIRLTAPAQVPPRTLVNAEEGFVTLLSDRSGKGDPQSVRLWNNRFRVDYTRVLHPGSKRRAMRPITELALRGRRGPCGGGPARAAARKRRGLWARGKGRFRTRGRFGAGTVRGTHWLTRETCDGTLFKVRRGVVTVSDLTVDRAFAVGPGESYLVQPPDPRRGASRG